MFSFVFVGNCQCMSWWTWLLQFPLWLGAPVAFTCIFLSRWLGFSSPSISFALLPSALSYLCVLLCSSLLISVFAVHCTVLGAVDFCCLCVPVWTSQDSNEIYAYGCWCFMCLSPLLCFCRYPCFFPPHYQPLLRVINQKWTWTSQPSPK